MANEQVNMKKTVPVVILVVVVIFLIAFGSRMTKTIDAGHGGVLFRIFAGGVELDKTYSEGFHIIAPWNHMITYEVRQNEIGESMNVLSSNGLEIKVDVSTWYHANFKDLPLLHAEIGQDYVRRIVIPSIRSATRTVIGKYTPEELYSSDRKHIQEQIFDETVEILKDKYVVTDRVLIRSIVLPPSIKNAIEKKLEQEQQSLEYEFKLEKETKEAERRRIEAEGKAAANRIISNSLTDKILREKGIEATLKLANSPNSKIVVIGNSDDGMPIILGGDK
jgi:regulator of protease activity HflC (stomatin/prohibitin superfamily)